MAETPKNEAKNLLRENRELWDKLVPQPKQDSQEEQAPVVLPPGMFIDRCEPDNWTEKDLAKIKPKEK
jgi:hypothetical protein